jgi:hypothetical protein
MAWVYPKGKMPVINGDMLGLKKDKLSDKAILICLSVAWQGILSATSFHVGQWYEHKQAFRHGWALGVKASYAWMKSVAPERITARDQQALRILQEPFNNFTVPRLYALYNMDPQGIYAAQQEQWARLEKQK